MQKPPNQFVHWSPVRVNFSFTPRPHAKSSIIHLIELYHLRSESLKLRKDSLTILCMHPTRTRICMTHGCSHPIQHF
ncbi:hypothetical protein BC830DRAFT_1156621 [Chytriomyces sp. MP71]|nr:hypothetical protein BC830DRAFT_1156621 [Chytriomyces sp. MP71]